MLRILGLLVDHTGPDERLRVTPEALAGEFALDPGRTRAAYDHLAAVGTLRPTRDGWVIPGASRLHGQQLRPADVLDTIATILHGSDDPVPAPADDVADDVPRLPVEAPADASTDPTSGTAPTGRRLRPLVLAAAALVVAVGIGALAFDGSPSTEVRVAIGPTIPTAPAPPTAVDDRPDPLLRTADTTRPPTPTADTVGPPAEPTPGTTARPAPPVPATSAPGPLAANPPGELVCPAPPPHVNVTSTAVSPDLELVGGWVLVVRGTVDGHPDIDAVIGQVLARITAKDFEIEARALDEPEVLAAGDELRWRAQLRVPPGAAPPQPEAMLGDWHWADPGLTACP